MDKLVFALTFGALLCSALSLLLGHLFLNKIPPKQTALLSLAWLTLAFISGLMNGFLAWYTPLIFVGFFLLCYFALVIEDKALLKWPSLIMAILVGLALAAHQVPGFENHLLIPPQQLNENSYSFRLYVNFDKTLVGIAIALCLLFSKRYLALRKAPSFTNFVLPSALHVLTIIGLALLLGAVVLDLKATQIIFQFLVINLLTTCIAEEFFFRGLIQKNLQESIGIKFEKIAGASALVITAILFGLAHSAGGTSYTLLAGLSALFNGYIFMKTQRVEYAIFSHFALNAIHFCFFSYPALIR